MSGSGWYGRPVAAAAALLAAVASSALILAGAEYGPRESDALSVYAVTIRHHGVDAREMERSVAVPLEDALAAVSGVVEVSSRSDYGQARVSARFSRVSAKFTRVSTKFTQGSEDEAAYEAVREAAQRVYETLPPSAQRPEIASTSEGRGPAWVAAVYSDRHDAAALGRLVDRAVKPALERLRGAGGVEVASSGLPEIAVEIDGAAAARSALGPADVARALADSDILAPAGSILSGGVESAIVADGRSGRPEDLLDFPMPNASASPAPLGAFARVARRERIPDALSRVDGRRAVTVAVMPGGGANLPALSRAISVETARLSVEHGLRFQTLSDAGADLGRSFGSMIAATAQGAAAVALASALLVGGAVRARLVAVAVVPAIIAIAAAALAALGLGLDRHALAGLAVGLGASVDTVILVAERLARAGTPDEGRAAMRELAPSLASGAATTLVVLVPLAGLDFLSEGVAAVAAAIASVAISSYAIAVLAMPPLILAAPGGRRFRVRPMEGRRNAWRLEIDRRLAAASAGAARSARRLLALAALTCATRPALILGVAAALGIGGAIGLSLAPLDTRGGGEGTTVYAHAEFKAGAAIEEVDERLARYSESLASVRGVLSVQSTARRGSGSVLVSFDPGIIDRDAVAEACRKTALPGGFAWIPEPSADERSWELTVSGDDDEACRRIAERAAGSAASLPFVIDTVLNFKDGPDDVALEPDRRKAAAIGATYAGAADALRRGIHGPVAYKRIGDDGETDVRVEIAHSSDGPSLDEAMALYVAAGSGAVRVDSFIAPGRLRDVTSVRRRDRRRIASITLRCGPVDPRKARDAAMELVAGLGLPAGFSIEFDRDAIEAAERLGGVGLSFAVAAALAYMATAFVTESFGAPLAVMASLPPSLAVPALLIVLAGIPIDASIACAFVAVSGMAVNASVLTVEERRKEAPRSAAGRRVGAMDLYRVTRARAASLAATSFTGVLGAAPFLFMPGSGDAMARSLAFVAATGTAASFVAALTVVPAIAAAAPGLFYSFDLDRRDRSAIEKGRPR